MNIQDRQRFDVLYDRLLGTESGSRHMAINALWPLIWREMRGPWALALHKAAPYSESEDRFQAASEAVVRYLQAASEAPRVPLSLVFTIARRAVAGAGSQDQAQRQGAGSVAAVRKTRFASKAAEQLEAHLGRTASITEMAAYANEKWQARRADVTKDGAITEGDVRLARLGAVPFDEAVHSDPAGAEDPLDVVVITEDADEVASLFAGISDTEVAVLACVFLDGAESASSVAPRLRSRGTEVCNPGVIQVSRSDVDSVLRCALDKLIAARGHADGLVTPGYRYGGGSYERELIAA